MASYRSFLAHALLLLLALMGSHLANAALPDGIARVHFHRMTGDYDGWGLHVWGDGLALDHKVSWARPLTASGSDGFGVYFDIPITPTAQRLGFILHKGSEKNVAEDMNVNLASTKEVWSIEGDTDLYSSRAAAAATLAPTQKKAEIRQAADRINDKKEAALKAEMLAVAKKSELEAQQKEEEAKQKAEEEQAQKAAERDKIIADLKAKRDYQLANSEQERFAKQKREMAEEMARRAAIYAKKQERQTQHKRLSPGQFFATAVGGGFAFLLISAVLFVLLQRRKALRAKAQAEATALQKARA